MSHLEGSNNVKYFKIKFYIETIFYKHYNDDVRLVATNISQKGGELE